MEEIKEMISQTQERLDKWWQGVDDQFRALITSTIAQYVTVTGSPSDEERADMPNFVWSKINILLKRDINNLWHLQLSNNSGELNELIDRISKELSDIALSSKYGLDIDEMADENSVLFPKYNAAYTDIYFKILATLKSLNKSSVN